MKHLKSVLITLLGTFLLSHFAIGQDYKHPYGLIKVDGMVQDSTGKHIGWVTKEGIIKDETGKKVAELDATGQLVDAKTGKQLGKGEKNGNYAYHTFRTADDHLTTLEPLNGNCEVKNKNGKTIVVVHENYKQVGACAFHCLQVSKTTKDKLMK